MVAKKKTRRARSSKPTKKKTKRKRHALKTLADLRPAPYNPRKISGEAAAGLGASLRQFGDVSGLVWNKRSGCLVAGHQRLEQLRAQGAELVDGAVVVGGKRFAVRVVDWDAKTERAANIAANSQHIAGEWTDELAPLLTGIEEGLGDAFGELRFDVLFDEIAPAKVVDEDEVPEPPKKAITKLGDVWRLGRHRVVCGDAARMKHKKKCALVFTSPPYEQQRDYTQASDISDWGALMRGVFGNLLTTDAAQVLVNLGMIHRNCEWLPYWDGWIAWMRERGWRRFGWYVWDKGEPTAPRGKSGRLPTAHEWIFHFCKTAVCPNKTEICKHAGESHPVSLRQKDGSLLNKGRLVIGSRKHKDSVFRRAAHKARGDIGEEHPARMSVALATDVLASWHGVVCDPFLGSGTTLIAAEQLDRICYGIEIEPRYVDVVIERWENLTGKKAKHARS